MKKHYLFVFIIILALNFSLPRLMPGDPFLYLEVTDGNVDTAYQDSQIEQYRRNWELDKPIPVQFLHYLHQLAHADLGYSIFYNRSVRSMIGGYLPWTLLLVTSSLVLSSVSGILSGAYSAFRRFKKSDRIFYSMMVALTEIPGFILGILFLLVFASMLKWFPLSGAATAFARYPHWGARVRDVAFHAALPVLTLSISHMGEFYLLSRASMITVLSKEYMTTALGKGLSRSRILFHHLLRNAMPPIAARIAISFGKMIGSAVLVENIFAYPGIGTLMKEAVQNRDYPLMQGTFLVVAASILLLNWLADLFYAKLHLEGV